MEVQKFDFNTHTKNSYAHHIHQLNRKWWYDKEGNLRTLDLGERFMLMVSELAEGMEGARKELYDDNLPHYPNLWVELADCVIRVLDSSWAYAWNLEYFARTRTRIFLVEEATISGKLYNCILLINKLAEIYITDPRNALAGEFASRVIQKCVDIAIEDGCSGEQFWQIVYEKLCFNQTRPDHQYDARALPGGKKF